jgi:hypothetical protein
MSHAALCTSLAIYHSFRWTDAALESSAGINGRPVCWEVAARVHCTLHGKLVAAGDSPPQEADHVRTGVDQVPTARPAPVLASRACLPLFHTLIQRTHTDTGRAHTDALY